MTLLTWYAIAFAFVITAVALELWAGFRYGHEWGAALVFGMAAGGFLMVALAIFAGSSLWYGIGWLCRTFFG